MLQSLYFEVVSKDKIRLFLHFDKNAALNLTVFVNTNISDHDLFVTEKRSSSDPTHINNTSRLMFLKMRPSTSTLFGPESSLTPQFCTQTLLKVHLHKTNKTFWGYHICVSTTYKDGPTLRDVTCLWRPVLKLNWSSDLLHHLPLTPSRWHHQSEVNQSVRLIFKL